MGIRKQRCCTVLGTLVLYSGSVLPQQQRANTPNQPGLPAGVWESVIADGSAVGIDLMEEHPAGDSTQRKAALQVGVFQKQHQRIACGEENFFIIGETDPNHDTVDSYSHEKLEIKYHDHVSGLEIELELIHDPIIDVWRGHFRRGRFDGQVVLHRSSDRPDPGQGGCFVASNLLTSTSVPRSSGPVR